MSTVPSPQRPDSNGSPLLSVITVTFRNDEGLRRTLDSIALLKSIPTEVIVVDGASLATTRQLVHSIVPGARLIQEPDEGPYDAMNKAAMIATGYWVWFLNAGDTVANDVAQPAIERLMTETQGAVIVGKALRPEGGHWPSDPVAVRSGFQSPCHQAILTPRTLLRSPAFDCRLKIAADYDAFMAASRDADVLFTNESICMYEGGGISSKRRLRLEYELLAIRLRYGREEPLRLLTDLLRVPWRAMRGVALRSTGNA